MSQHRSLTTATTTNHQTVRKGARLILAKRILWALLITGVVATSALAVTNRMVSAIARIDPNASTGDFAGATGVLYINGKTDAVPFKGMFQGNDTVTPPSTIATTGTGIGTLLGQFSFTQGVTVNGANLTDTGSAHWIAANGDSIDTTVAGSAIPGAVVFTRRRFTPLLVGPGDSRVPRGALPCTARTSWHPVRTERTSPPDGSRGPLLPRVRLSENTSISKV